MTDAHSHRISDWAGLCELASRVGGKLVARKQTVAIAESSAGGLISAALLAVPGASAYFRGGAAVYTLDAKSRFLDQTPQAMSVPRAATQAHAQRLADAVRDRLGTHWGIGETGASGPTGNRYGDPAGHTCVAATGPDGKVVAATIATGSDDRQANMFAFAGAALSTLEQALGESAA